MKPNSFNIVIGAIAALAGILMGYDTGVISGVILFAKQEFQLTPFLTGLIVGTVPAGALLGSLLSGRIADQFGRRNLLIVTAIIYIIGTLITSTALNTPWLIIGRFIIGLAIGISSYTAPLYLSEIAPAHLRGMLVSFNQLAITIGIVLAYLVNFAFSAHGQWRYMFGMGLIPAIMLFVGMLFLPYSPRWLVHKGKIDKARNILRRIRPSLESAEMELQHIISVSISKGSWWLLMQPWVRPAMIVAVGLAVIQQITGINTIIYYAPSIFTMGGFESTAAALLATIGIGVINVLATIVALPLIDRWGRRPLLLLGIFLMIVSMLLISYFFHLQQIGGGMQVVPLLCMFVYIIGFAISLGPITWLMIVEMFPLEVRGMGSSISTAFNWGSNMIVGLSFLSLVYWLKPSGTFLLFSIISILSWFFVYFIVPETKDVSLETIEDNLRAGKPMRWLGK